MRTCSIESCMGDTFVTVINNDGSAVELCFSGGQFEEAVVYNEKLGKKSVPTTDVNMVYERTAPHMDHG